MSDIAQLMQPVAERLLGEPNKHMSKKGELRYGKKGSLSVDLGKGTFFDHETKSGGGVLDLIRREHDDPMQWLREQGLLRDDSIVAAFDYPDENGNLLFQVCRLAAKGFRQRRPDGKGGWVWSLKADKKRGLPEVRRVLYRLPELLGSKGTVFLPEGEKHVDALRALGLRATTNSGGAGKWRSGYCEHLRGEDVVVLPDNDKVGQEHAEKVAAALQGTAASVRVLPLPGLGPKGDVINWLAAGGNKEQLLALAADTAPWVPSNISSVSLDDFVAYMPMHEYVFLPTGETWPAASVNARISADASKWLDANRPVEQMTWYPGEPQIIKDRLLGREGGWIERAGCATLNLYRPPTVGTGDLTQAGPWLELVRELFPDDAEHILDCCAHCRQHPDRKINHALVLIGAPGIGKDTILEPLARAVGPWNFKSISPIIILGPFNSHLKSVVLNINEARDLGDVNRVSFYEHSKVFLASPPAALYINEKHVKEYLIPNLCFCVITTNHKVDGLYLTADDRRHYVACSELEESGHPAAWWTEFYKWLDEGGDRHVAAWLDARDLSKFNPKAPPEKTDAFWEIVSASESPEESELRDVLDTFKGQAVTIPMVADAAYRMEIWGLGDFLRDRTRRRAGATRMSKAGYEAARNHGALDGYWAIKGAGRRVVYVPKGLRADERTPLINALAERGEGIDAGEARQGVMNLKRAGH